MRACDPAHCPPFPHGTVAVPWPASSVCAYSRACICVKVVRQLTDLVIEQTYYPTVWYDWLMGNWALGQKAA